MAFSPSAPTSPLPRQLLRFVSSQLAAAVHRPAPTISLPSLPRIVNATAASERLRAAPSPKPRAGAVVITRRPTPPAQPAQGSGGKVHHAVPTAATARVVMRGGPARPSRPAEGSGGKVHAVSPAAATASVRVVMRGPAPPGSPAEGPGGSGGSHH